MMKGRNGEVKEKKGDMMTSLLDSTDSDVEWLSLPPIKGKKPKRKKASMKPRDTSLCDTWTLLKAFLCIGTAGAVVLLTVTTIWLSSQLNAVRQTLKEVESKGSVNGEDILKLQGVVMHLNKTLELEAKNSKLLLDNITAINGTILKLSKSLDDISEGIEAAPEIKQIPEKLKMFSTTLVEMGSDVSTLKETVKSIDPFHKATTAKLDNLTKQIEDIKQAAESESQPSDALSPQLANLMQVIPQKVEDLNVTISGQIAVMMKSLTVYEEKFVQLENQTKTLMKSLSEIQGDHSTISNEHDAMAGTDFTSDEFKTAVSDIVQDMIPQMGTNVSEASPVLSSTRIGNMVTNITDLLQRINNLEKLQGSGSGEVGDLSPDSLDTLRASLEEQLQVINSSLSKLRSDHDHVTSIVMTHSNSLVSIAHQVNMTLFYINRLEQKLNTVQSQTTSVTPTEAQGETSQHVSTGSVTLSPDGIDIPQPTQPVTPKIPEGPIENDNNSIGTSKPVSIQPELSPPTEQPTTTTTDNPSIVIPIIKDVEDLKRSFASWSHGYTVSQIAYDDLSMYLGPYIPDEAALKKFDEDGSGTYSLQEFAKALGFSLSGNEETDLPPTDESIPPR